MQARDPRHLLIEIVRILEELKIPYIITGGMAIFVWGRPRFTADIDIVVELKTKDIDDLAESLSKVSRAGYISRDAIEEALTRQGEFNYIDGDTGVKVDFWILKEDAFDVLRMKRRVAKEILGKQVYFISPEDLILSKLQWYQQSWSDKHLEDVKSVIKISGETLNKGYLTQWAKKLDVLDNLKKLS